MRIDKTAETRIESELDTKLKELGIDDALREIPNVTSRMLVAFGEHDIKTVEDLADCATDDLIGWDERKNGKSIRHAGALEGFAIERKEADTVIMQARVKAGSIDEPALTPLVLVERGPVAEPQPQVRKNTIWDIEIERREVPEAPFAAELAAFERHKKPLLDILRKVHGGDPKSKLFGEEDSWRALTRAAIWYFRRPEIKQKTMLAARRVERLRELAKALDRARHMADKAMQDDVGWDLFRGWCAEANTSPAWAVLNADGSSVLTPIANQFKKVMGSLTALETAASRAARDAPTKAGPPRGAGILPLDDIIALAAVYRRSTGKNPMMGAGPFAKLIEKFFIAIGRGDDTKQDYVFEALKYQRKQARKNPAK
jgi:hypothetical protein